MEMKITTANIEWTNRHAGKAVNWTANLGDTVYWIKRNAHLMPRLKIKRFWSIEDNHGAAWGEFKTVTEAMNAVEEHVFGKPFECGFCQHGKDYYGNTCKACKGSGWITTRRFEQVQSETMDKMLGR